MNEDGRTSLESHLKPCCPSSLLLNAEIVPTLLYGVIYILD